MAGPWLYAITGTKGHTFLLKGGRSLPVTTESYTELVNSERLDEDPDWGIWQNGRNAKIGDEVYIYTRDKDLGIIGFGRIEKIAEEGKLLHLEFNYVKCRQLLKNPVPALLVRSWGLNLRPNLVNLAKAEKRLRAALPKDFAPPAKVNVEDKPLSTGAIDSLILKQQLLLPSVDTGDEMAATRRRRGQDRLRKLCLQHYRNCCAVCDVTESSKLLVASHIVGWAESPLHRGVLSNVICLCRMHDALFEAGYWSLDDNLKILRKKDAECETIKNLLRAMRGFSEPIGFSPEPRFIKRHRKQHGFNC